jgi:hypothetical protein
MATNKNQHFVPRCYLRPFTIDEADKAINLYNIDGDRFVEGASVKKQCSSDYFYGKSPLLETAIQNIEGTYATTVKMIHQPNHLLTDGDRTVLKILWLFQHLRTEAAAKRSSEMSNAITPDDSNFRLEIRDAVQIAMRTFPDVMEIVSDLKTCLIRNRSGVPFITSDDPAILTNRWHLQDEKRTALSFGLHSSGALLLLPLSPTVLCLAYDGDVYSVSHDKGWVDLRSNADADAFNQHQYLNCRANIFIKNPAHFQAVRDAFQRVSGSRPSARYQTHYAVFDKTVDGYSRYVVVDRRNAEPHEKALVHSQVIYATPSAWPSQIRWRKGGSVFTNGTGMGYVRRSFTQRDDTEPFKKVRIFGA